LLSSREIAVVNNRAPGRGTTTNKRRAAKRLVVRQAAAQRAAARRRRQLAIGGLVAIVIFGLVVAIVVSCRGGTAGRNAAPAASGSTSASASTAAFPPLPPGADPALGTKPAVTAGTGALAKLVVTPLIEGKGAPATAGQTLTVNYVGVSYTTGKEFDSSWSRAAAFPFPLGQGRVIKGWDQGLVGVKVGSRVQLDIPADLAYGEQASGGGPSGPLRFVVDVLAAQ
jgi:peptidylprolyl isomerase